VDFVCFFFLNRQNQCTCVAFKPDRGPRGTGENICVGGELRVEGGCPVGTNFKIVNLFRAASQISITFVLSNGYFVVISISNEP